MQILLVEVNIKAERLTDFLELIKYDAEHSENDEPGCLRFDVVQDNSDPNKFFFYEVYLDENALKAHQASAHYPRWRAAAAEVLAEPAVASRCTTIFPKDYK